MQGRDSHVEDTNGTKSTRVPLSHVALHSGLHGICKFSDDWNGPCRAGEMPFLVPVHGLLEDKEGGDDGEGGVKPSNLVGGGSEEGGDGDVNERGGRGGGVGDGRGIMAEEGRHVNDRYERKPDKNDGDLCTPSSALIGSKKSVDSSM